MYVFYIVNVGLTFVNFNKEENTTFVNLRGAVISSIVCDVIL